jgi:outer membrane protein OmpA-like peptidoglycan-associated protein
MSPKIFLLVAGALLPATASAQSAPEAKSPEQIRCELNNNCVEEPVAVAATAAGDAAVATRGWKFVPRTQPRTAATSTAATRTRSQNLAPAARTSRTAAAQRVRHPVAKPKSTLAINFTAGTATFTPEGRLQANNVLAALKSPELVSGRYLITGHTDSAGNPELNRELSRRRAQALADFLVDKGLSRSRFRVRGYGYDRPLDGKSATDSSNRRVEIVKLD